MPALVIQPSHQLSDKIATSPSTPTEVVVFLFPGLSGDLLELHELLKPANATFRMVPIRYRHWTELQSEEINLDQLIADCTRQVESQAPFSPLLFLGYSFGGLLAWLVADAMIANEWTIGLLGMIDAVAIQTVEDSAETIIKRFGRVLRGIRRGETAQQLARSCAGILYRSPTGRLRARFRQFHGYGILPRILNCIDLNLQVRYYVPLLTALVARIKASNARLQFRSVLFRCSEWPASTDSALGWRHYLANLRVVSLPGNHASVLKKSNAEQINTQIAVILSENEDLSASLTRQLSVNQSGYSLPGA
jgi:thioesterase domain-containing protein